MYPEVVEITPAVLSNGGSIHQKQPPANVAVAVVSAAPALKLKQNSSSSG
jgi:hypothetical protein